MKKKITLIIVSLLVLLPILTGCTAEDPGWVITSSSELEAARGNIPGMSTVHKYGRNIEIDSGVTADIWDGGYTVGSGGNSLIWVAPTQARIHNIASSSASDDGSPAGAGARTLRIHGLTSWNTPEVPEDVILNGTTNVPTVNSYVIIYRMKVLTKGATNVNVGSITATAQTDNTVTARIRIGQGQTHMAVYGVPSTQTLYLTSIYSSMLRASAAASGINMRLLLNPEPDVELLNFLSRRTYGMRIDGTSAVQHIYDPPATIPGPAILKMEAVSGANNTDVSAGFDGIIIDN